MLSKRDEERLESARQALASAARELQALIRADSRLIGKLCRDMAGNVANLNERLRRLQALSDTEMDMWLQVLDRAEVVLGTEENAVCWFSSYSSALDGIPMYIITRTGALEQIMNQLGRMKHGVYS